MSGDLTRAELVEIVLAATTDEVVDDQRPDLGVERPNILVEGCRGVRVRGARYPDPEAAARVFAGVVADALLARLTRERAA